LGGGPWEQYNAKRFIDKKRYVFFEFKPGTVAPTPRYFISSTMQKANIPEVVEFTDWIKSEAGFPEPNFYD